MGGQGHLEVMHLVQLIYANEAVAYWWNRTSDPVTSDHKHHRANQKCGMPLFL